MQQPYNYDKFREWLTLKRYSPSSVATTIKVVEYFRAWAANENIHELEEVGYSDAMSFIRWSGKQGVTQKTIANYLAHINKLYNFFLSESSIEINPVAHIKIQGIKRKVYYNILSEEELQCLYQQYPTTIEYEAGKTIPPQYKNTLSRKRNKVIIGLLVQQGLRAEEIAALQLEDVQLRAGEITIHAQRRTAERTMQLAPHQVYELVDYIHDTRKQIAADQEEHTPYKKDSGQLFIQWKNGDSFYNITRLILKHLRKINGRVKNIDQIRTSVITQWLKKYDIRKVQYMAGHKYVSSTEAYKENIIDELQDDIIKFHPIN